MPITTVHGPVPIAEITGRVLAHEHLHIDLRTDDDSAAVVHDADSVVEELRAAREEHDLGLVVDLTCRGMGRDVSAVRRIAERAGIRVVVATGYYYERFHPAGELDAGPAAVTERLLAEIEDGLDGTTIRPGVLGEIGSDGPVASPAERTSFLAAGAAGAATGLAVATHAHLGEGGLEQLDLLTSAGLAPQRISIGHQDLADLPAQHRALAAEGAFVAFDTVGKESYQPDAVRLRLVLDLIEAGHAGQLLLSNDISRDAYLAGHGGPGFGHVLGTFRTRLAEHGVDGATLDLLYRRNALRWLSGESAA